MNVAKLVDTLPGSVYRVDMTTETAQTRLPIAVAYIPRVTKKWAALMNAEVRANAAEPGSVRYRSGVQLHPACGDAISGAYDLFTEQAATRYRRLGAIISDACANCGASIDETLSDDTAAHHDASMRIFAWTCSAPCTAAYAAKRSA
jgi:hypothetical protein